MKKLLFTFLSVLACTLGGAQTFKISVQKDVALNQLKTFNVTKGEIVSTTSRSIDQEAFYTEFKNFVIRELQDKGYEYIPEAGEFSVSYVVEISEQMETQNLGPLGETPVDNPVVLNQPQHWSREFTEGTLIIDIEDPQRKKSVWTATGTMDVTKAGGSRLLDRCVRKAFKKFPKRRANKKG